MRGIKNLSSLKGFTLVELLVVIAIIGILATIVILNVMSARTKADESVAKQTATEVNKSIRINEALAGPVNFISATEYPKFSNLLLSLKDDVGNQLYSAVPQWVSKAESDNPNSFEVKEWPTIRVYSPSTASLGVPEGTVVDLKERAIQINDDYELSCQEVVGVTYQPGKLLRKTCIEHKIGTPKSF